MGGMDFDNVEGMEKYEEIYKKLLSNYPYLFEFKKGTQEIRLLDKKYIL